MNIRHIVFPCICLVLSSSLACADTAKTDSDSQAIPTPQLTAAQVIAKNVAARGGLKAWRSVHSMSMTGLMDAGRIRAKPAVVQGSIQKVKLDVNKNEHEDKVIQLPFAMEMKRPLKMRFELQFQGDTAVQTFDGTKGWKLRPFLGRREVEAYTPEEMKSAAQQQELDGFLIDYAAKGTRVESNGIEQLDGRDIYKLKLTLKNGQIRHAWVDAQTFLETKVDGSRRMDGKPHTVMTYFSNYKPVDGLMVPFAMETTVEGVKDSERIVIEKVALNPRLADSRFTRPD